MESPRTARGPLRRPAADLLCRAHRLPATHRGAQGTPSANNTPGNRDTGQVWTDTSGNVWIFGGNDTANNHYNDLWKYSNGEWTWMGGSDVPNQAGIYGTLGTPSAANIPGARGGAIHWIDSSGNIWLFGGIGYDSAGTNGYLNDLWKYSNGEWTWMGGSNLANQKGVYGTMGTNSANNIPGARRRSIAWVDSQGKRVALRRNRLRLSRDERLP
ncbi:MAG: kelch repeat-containing protein [Steroidobacteraceae bacterium]